MSTNKTSATAKVQGKKAPQEPKQRPASASSKPALIKPAPSPKGRKAKLQISRVDPWSVLKMAFLLSVALGIVTVVAVIALWFVLDMNDIFGRINSILGGGAGGFDIRSYASLGQVASFATIIAVVNVVLLTALAMLAAVLYNISATLVGGFNVTLTDE